MLGEVPMIEPTLSDEFETLLQWADQIKTVMVGLMLIHPKMQPGRGNSVQGLDCAGLNICLWLRKGCPMFRK